MSLILARWVASVFLPLGIAVATMALLGLLRRPRPRYLCPGPVRPLRARLNPLGLLLHEACNFDLHRNPAVNGWITCPECARRSTPRQLRRSAPSLRLVALSLLLLGPGALCFHLVTRGEWRQAERALPTTVVILIKRAGPGIPGRFHPELGRRAADGSLRPWQARLAAPALVGDLHQDSLYNTRRIALNLLAVYSSHAQRPLEQALHSADWCQRHHAARLLRNQEPENPSDDLIRVTVESVRSGEQGRPLIGYIDRYSTREAVQFLRHHVLLARPHLVAGLNSDDAQQRVLCAFILGVCSLNQYAAEVVAVLVESLRSNTVSEDARLAIYGLAGLGESAIPFLEPLLQSEDPQQRQAALLLLERTAGLDPSHGLSRLISRGIGINLSGEPWQWHW